MFGPYDLIVLNGLTHCMQSTVVKSEIQPRVTEKAVYNVHKHCEPVWSCLAQVYCYWRKVLNCLGFSKAIRVDADTMMDIAGDGARNP